MYSLGLKIYSSNNYPFFIAACFLIYLYQSIELHMITHDCLVFEATTTQSI